VFILVIPYFIDKSYLQRVDGSSQISATINAPENNYASFAAFALVKGQLHIFGGDSDTYKVRPSIPGLYKVQFCLTNKNNEIIKN
jgi:hypothetical protein